MNKQTVLWRLLAAIVFLCCFACQKPGEIRPISGSKKEAQLEPMTAELKRLYGAAKTERDRRATCLKAIDGGLIDRGEPVSKVDQIFGTHFASELPDKGEAIKHGFILFADQLSLPPRPDGTAEGISYSGSYMDIDYDTNGAIQNYYISNLHKGGSRRTDDKEPMPLAELNRLYEFAKSESERRDVALQAIDEGVIQTFGPVDISNVDAIFGTRLASQLPTKKEVKRTGIVDFASSITATAPVKDEASTSKGWFMAVEYYHNGNIANYYLTNIGK